MGACCFLMTSTLTMPTLSSGSVGHWRKCLAVKNASTIRHGLLMAGRARSFLFTIVNLSLDLTEKMTMEVRQRTSDHEPMPVLRQAAVADLGEAPRGEGNARASPAGEGNALGWASALRPARSLSCANSGPPAAQNYRERALCRLSAAMIG